MFIRRGYLLFAVVCIMLSGTCDNSSPVITPERIEALVNNEAWATEAICKTSAFDPSLVSILALYYTDGILTERLTLSLVPPFVGNYEIRSSGTGSNDLGVGADYTLIGLDGKIDKAYKYDDDIINSGFVQIELFNDETKEIKGTFEITLVNIENSSDTVHFKSGWFHTRKID